MPEWLDIVITVMLTLAGREGLGLWNARVQARKLQAQVQAQEIDNRIRVDADEWNRLRDLVADIQADNQMLRADNKALREDLDGLKARESSREIEMNRLRMGVVILVSQLREYGIEPKWEPYDEVGTTTKVVTTNGRNNH